MSRDKRLQEINNTRLDYMKHIANDLASESWHSLILNAICILKLEGEIEGLSQEDKITVKDHEATVDG